MVTGSVRRAGAAVVTRRIGHPRAGTGEGLGAEIGDHETEVEIGDGVDPEIGTGGLEAETGKYEEILTIKFTSDIIFISRYRRSRSRDRYRRSRSRDKYRRSRSRDRRRRSRSRDRRSRDRGPISPVRGGGGGNNGGTNTDFHIRNVRSNSPDLPLTPEERDAR